MKPTMKDKTRRCPPGLGLRQPSGAVEMGVKWPAARFHTRSLQILKQKAVVENRRRQGGIGMVRDTGFEPVTPTVSM